MTVAPGGACGGGVGALTAAAATAETLTGEGTGTLTGEGVVARLIAVLLFDT